MVGNGICSAEMTICPNRELYKMRGPWLSPSSFLVPVSGAMVSLSTVEALFLTVPAVSEHVDSQSVAIDSEGPMLMIFCRLARLTKIRPAYWKIYAVLDGGRLVKGDVHPACEMHPVNWSTVLLAASCPGRKVL
jgi:hypothetical protein